MNDFSYVRATGPAEAMSLLAQEDGSRLLAGGTDLLPLIKEDILSPLCLVDLTGWSDGKQIEEKGDGLRIGALATLDAIASHPVVRSRFTALSDACRLAASPQLRKMGTIGGNLLQQTRCWYYRGPFNCWLKGGDTCYARNGENEHHAIYHTNSGESICVTAHPSDAAAALIALDAAVDVATPGGTTSLPVERLFALPTAQYRSLTRLPEGSVITAILLPQAQGERRSVYLKAMPRATWAFALAGVALSVILRGETIVESRVALAGVAPVPLRMHSVEGMTAGKSLSELDVPALTLSLLSTASPLSLNGYKMDLVSGLFKQALAALSAKSSS